uniref:CTLH domain-containing protein n=1 Tax=Trichuris muris TaxID=70415 RepID=A0A5S6Q8D9_TRIMR
MASCVRELMMKLLRNPDLDCTTQMDDCVMQFLNRAGFTGLYDQFKIDRLSRPSSDTSMMEPMNDIERYLLNGDIDSALHFIVKRKPELLDENPDVLFLMLKQKFIELVRNKDIDAALEFAQDCLSGRAASNPKSLGELEKICGIMAFDNPESSMFADYMKLNQRVRVLHAVSNLWLLSELGKPYSDFDLLFKFIEWAQSTLEERNIPYPKLYDCAFEDSDSLD